MKKSLLILALVTGAGTVAAQTAVPPSVVIPQMPPPTESGVMQPSVGSGSANRPTVRSISATTPAINPPSDAAPGATPALVAIAPPASSGSVAASGEAQARARIVDDGYTGVTGLTKGSDGIWRGTAMRGSTPVQLQVDARGTVSMQ